MPSLENARRAFHGDDKVSNIVPAPSPAAQRMRDHRHRKKKRLRCLTIQLRETEVAKLIEYGLLTKSAKDDRVAVLDALHKFLDGAFRSPS
jgi:hypothetical protein